MRWVYHGKLPLDLPYHFEAFGATADEATAVYDWCIQEFGASATGQRWQGLHFKWFRDEIDATHFRLRWC